MSSQTYILGSTMLLTMCQLNLSRHISEIIPLTLCINVKLEIQFGQALHTSDLSCAIDINSYSHTSQSHPHNHTYDKLPRCTPR